MIGFIGTRSVRDLGGGLLQQYIHCNTEEEKKFWRDIYPEGEPVRAVFPSEMEMILNTERCQRQVVFQSPEERDQFRKTFIQRGDFDHFARWLSPHLLLLGSIAKAISPGTPAGVVEEAPEEQWRQLSDAKLRTAAAEMGLPNIDKKEGREMLISRMKRHAAEVTA